MWVKQIYTSCLAEASYYIDSNGEAIIIDPIRDTKPYIDLARQRNTRIKYIFETHFHADFVSGHLELSRLTGAKIVFGPNAITNYEVINAQDGQFFQIGDLKLKVLHTPGHTPESSCYLLFNARGEEEAVFTGDTLFIGEVGRPDLAVSDELSQNDLAEHLYNSLHNVLMKLPNDVKVFPAHGAGSACGKNISDEKHSTIGQQKKENYALQPMSMLEFVDKVLDGIKQPPGYFSHDVDLNRNGYSSAASIINKSLNPLSYIDIDKHVINGAILLDVRMPSEFEKHFYENSINIGKAGMFAPWVGTLIDPNASVIIICNQGEQNEVISRLTRIGYHNVLGYAEINSLPPDKLTTQIHSISAGNINRELDLGVSILDVRRLDEFKNGHIENAIHIPLEELNNRLDELNKNKNYLIYCAGGYRSMVACSICKKNGYDNVKNIYGGFGSILQSNNVHIV